MGAWITKCWKMSGMSVRREKVVERRLPSGRDRRQLRRRYPPCFEPDAQHQPIRLRHDFGAQDRVVHLRSLHGPREVLGVLGDDDGAGEHRAIGGFDGIAVVAPLVLDRRIGLPPASGEQRRPCALRPGRNRRANPRDRTVLAAVMLEIVAKALQLVSPAAPNAVEEVVPPRIRIESMRDETKDRGRAVILDREVVDHAWRAARLGHADLEMLAWFPYENRQIIHP